MRITDAELIKIISYDPITGLFWRHDLQRNVGGLNKDGYIEMRIKGRHLYGHRLAWFLSYNYWPIGVDHEDNNRANNKLLNLRETSEKGNNKNTLKAKNNTSGFKGVCFHKPNKKWMATITLNYKTIYIGCFLDPVKAAEAYDQAAIKHHGIYAKTNKMLGLIP